MIGITFYRGIVVKQSLVKLIKHDACFWKLTKVRHHAVLRLKSFPHCVSSSEFAMTPSFYLPLSPFSIFPFFQRSKWILGVSVFPELYSTGWRLSGGQARWSWSVLHKVCTEAANWFWLQPVTQYGNNMMKTIKVWKTRRTVTGFFGQVEKNRLHFLCSLFNVLTLSKSQFLY